MTTSSPLSICTRMVALTVLGAALLAGRATADPRSAGALQLHTPGAASVFAIGSPATGTISGTIRWQKAYGYPEFSMPARPGTPAPNLTAAVTVKALPGVRPRTPAPVASIGTVELRLGDETPTEYQIAYTVRGLPLNVPIIIRVSDSLAYLDWQPGTDPASATSPRQFVQLGWTGSIVLSSQSLTPQPLQGGRRSKIKTKLTSMQDDAQKSVVQNMRAIAPGTGGTPPTPAPPGTGLRPLSSAMAFGQTQSAAQALVTGADFEMVLGRPRP